MTQTNSANQHPSPHEVALHITQHAIAALIDEPLPESCRCSNSKAVDRAKQLFKWDQAKIGTLRLLFDRVKLDKGQTERKNYLPIRAIAKNANPTIPYPINAPTPDNIPQLKAELLTLPIRQNWDNLSFLTLVLEQYGACLGVGELDPQGACDVALSDFARITAAVAAAIAPNPDKAKHLSLVAGGLSGIQHFIYTISSDGALKSLRARSFYLELVTEEVVQQLLCALKLPRTSIIYTGGSNFYLLAPNDVEATVKKKCQEINKWLRDIFQEKVFLAIDIEPCKVEDVATPAFRDTWNQAIKKVNQQKTQRLSEATQSDLETVLDPQPSYTPCKVCHDDRTEERQPLNPQDPESPLACLTCHRMFQLGDQLPDITRMVRSCRSELSKDPITFKFESSTVFYHLFENTKNVDFKDDTLLLINNWNLQDYQRKGTVPLLLGNYTNKVTEEFGTRFMRASEFAEQSEGIKRVGYLRMDVDRLGQIFANGLRDDYSLPKLAGLSRQMSDFFKVYLNSLASDRETNAIHPTTHYSFRTLNPGEQQRLLFIYAGGDDLFISGSWNEVLGLAFDVYESFRAYTGYNPDITLSGGISIAAEKFPLYQAARESGDAEDQAKANGRDSLGLFGTAFKWDQWLSHPLQFDDLDSDAKDHLDKNSSPDLSGVWTFVERLQTQLSGHYAQSFVRNLLATAQLQEQHIKKKEEQIHKREKELPPETDPILKDLKRDREEIRYYLHLPKIAYTLARLPSDLQNNQDFKPIRSSLLSPYNAPYFRAIATWIELLNRD
jgi:CRISPR-associated protein Csm1